MLGVQKMSHRDGSFDYPHYMFGGEITNIWRPGL